jgi:MOSC domain-containing protein YiiM
MGLLVSIAYSGGHGLPRPLHDRATVITGHGIAGDLRAGHHPNRHLNIMDAETLEELKAEGFPVGPGIMGENLVVQGIRLDQQPAGTHLRIGDSVLVETTKLREPCTNLTPIDARMPESVVGRVGVLATVLQGGEIRVGDPVKIVPGEAK